MKYSIIFLIKFYQYCISPMLGNCCRFYPSCSEYAKIAILKYGIIKGLKLTLKRISKCHPFGKHGYDPI
ncbi:MAG: membrane protein insertion efficiency factor YidD [Bacteroidetes bacterium]|nr:membrane protein insertion efficiency factor YidD [Bacteroidota bacterium]